MRRLAVIIAVLLCALPAYASSVERELTGAQLRGTATFRYVGISLYEARLYTKGGAELNWSEDFALEVTYLRNLKERALVDSTMKEFTRAGGALPVRDRLEVCYQDVRKGDTYLAVSDGPDTLEFWLNDTPACTLRYPQIKTRFMAIFLGDNTRSKSFTAQLKGP
ncbi:hypothetical protein shim_38470 [Shimia sp. SK013]|uniref:hypothetical protein n=1 Tax=Shimia sp. SK013 TaxID=1389006 RepID=UPI0006CE0873|nr:hypothetical protein [Shimia sp. SK013]KPA19888.1 hypothetical protein shim_38470 [Shimia sp. SK013]